MGDPGVALPLTEGNSWEYQQTTLDSAGIVTDSSGLTMTVGAPDTIADVTYHSISNFIFPYLDVTLWTNLPDGVYGISPLPPPPGPSPPNVSQLLSFPTFPGDTLVYRAYTLHTASLSVNIVVPAGSFNCVRYDIYSAGEMVAQLFITPNVGIIKAWRKTGQSRIVEELDSLQVVD